MLMAKDEGLGSIFDAEILYESVLKRGFSLLHRQVLGFSTIGLEHQLGISTRDINALDIDGRSPLYWAIRRGDIQTVSKFLACGADPSTAVNAIAWTCKGNIGDLQSLKLLLSFGANPDGHDLDGHTPLHACGIYGREEEFLKVLLAHGAEISLAYKGYYKEYTGITSLGFASLYAHDNTCQLLLSHGADPCHVDILGRTLLHLTVAGKSKGPRRVRTLERLLSAGADPNARDKAQKTPANYAMQIQDLDSLEILMKYNADVVFPPVPGSENNGFCILSWPIQKHWYDVVSFLLPRVDLRDTDPTTAKTILHALAEAGDLKLLVIFEEHLGQRSIPIDIRDDSGRLAIDLAPTNAVRKKVMELVHRLQERQDLLLYTYEDSEETFWDANEHLGPISQDRTGPSETSSADDLGQGDMQISNLLTNRKNEIQFLDEDFRETETAIASGNNVDFSTSNRIRPETGPMRDETRPSAADDDTHEATSVHITHPTSSLENHKPEKLLGGGINNDQSPNAEDANSKLPLPSQATATHSSVLISSSLYESLAEKPGRDEKLLEEGFSSDRDEDRDNDILLMGWHDQNIIRRLDKDTDDTDSGYGSDKGEAEHPLLSQSEGLRRRRAQRHSTVSTETYLLETSKTGYSWTFTTRWPFGDIIGAIFRPLLSLILTELGYMVVNSVNRLTQIAFINESRVKYMFQTFKSTSGGMRLALRRALRPQILAGHRRITWDCVSLTPTTVGKTT
jgi:ankyrin repeat protein